MSEAPRPTLPEMEWKQLPFDPLNFADPQVRKFWGEENILLSDIPFTQLELPMPDPTIDLVTERGGTHGKFSNSARASQRLKRIMREEMQARLERNQAPLTAAQQESLEMIFLKIGRILSGDANHPDHWDDIAGYAKIANGSF